MKELNLEEQKLKITFKGESHEMRLPSNKEVLALSSARNEEATSEESMELMYRFLEKLGLPRTFTESLSPGHTLKIMESVSDVKS